MATSPYSATNPRLSKDDLYMILALWMERFPDDEQSEDRLFKKVGAVLVLPNDICYAIDSSHHGVHAVARLIMAHPDKLKGSKVFVSRKPCSFCTKLLVQAKVERVFNLPIEPEYFPMKQLSEEEARSLGKSLKSEKECVDNLFKVSPIGDTTFAPEVEDVVVSAIRKRYYGSSEQQRLSKQRRKEKKNELLGEYWKEDEWMKNAREELPWQPFDDSMKDEVHKKFKNMMKWISTIWMESEKSSFKLEEYEDAVKPNISFNPATNEKEHKQAHHFMILAKFLAERTDDPRTGVGAVIINKKKEIVGLGWNGFPKKARYGEFARASHKDEGVPDKKYPYVIYAEENALMMRNTKNIEDGTLFVTNTPSDECTSLLEMQGIKTVVLGQEFIEEGQKQGISYTKFPDRVKKGKFACFLLKKEQE